MGPTSKTGGHDFPWLIDELVSGEAGVVEDVDAGCEYSVREPVFAHELPGVFDRVKFR